ncbi:MAG: protein-L-isoaspartate(D-aspartate) O-methyltransferase [Halobacteriovoraceae bacterium]|nr:protein-L-isoaspartate(D-aspartate) O-methyltransferase [Halobacteriovoraceae bacterium]MCB9095631.1 protein-L-isoaspartate(D-aspartate) O-methyltransferase [Halobacteriovoraceae bacterium]
MVHYQLVGRGVSQPRVLDAMLSVPRDEFIPIDLRNLSYTDGPLPIDYGQTISQPYIVAYMLQALEIKPTDRVLEVGTGSGYNAAVMSKLANEVYSVEIVSGLANESSEILKKLGFKNVHVRQGNGYQGWPEHAPFDVICLTAAPIKTPRTLFDQLAEGGRLIAPEGDAYQQLVLYQKIQGTIHKTDLIPVRFVPMIQTTS